MCQQTVFSEVDSNRALMPVMRGQRLRGAFLPAATQLKSVFSVAAGAFGTGRRRLRDVVSKRSPEGGQPAAAGGQVSEVSMNDLLGGADQQERRRLLESYLRDQAARKLGLTASRLDSHLPLNHFGIDSLMAMELRTEVERDLGIVVPIVQLLDGPTVAGLAEWLDGQLFGEATAVLNPTVAADTRATEHNDAAVSAVPGATDVTGTRWMDLLTQVPEISDDDVDELLSELLAAREYQDEG